MISRCVHSRMTQNVFLREICDFVMIIYSGEIYPLKVDSFPHGLTLDIRGKKLR